MPTIIKPGVIPTPKVPWYLSITWICEHCGCEFRMDAEDSIRIQVRADQRGRSETAIVACPTCTHTVKGQEPTKTKTFDDVVTENAWLSPQPVKRYLGDL